MIIFHVVLVFASIAHHGIVPHNLLLRTIEMSWPGMIDDRFSFNRQNLKARMTGKVYQLGTIKIRAALLRKTMTHIVYQLIVFSRNGKTPLHLYGVIQFLRIQITFDSDWTETIFPTHMEVRRLQWSRWGSPTVRHVYQHGSDPLHRVNRPLCGLSHPSSYQNNFTSRLDVRGCSFGGIPKLLHFLRRIVTSLVSKLKESYLLPPTIPPHYFWNAKSGLSPNFSGCVCGGGSP